MHWKPREAFKSMLNASGDLAALSQKLTLLLLITLWRALCVSWIFTFFAMMLSNCFLQLKIHPGEKANQHTATKRCHTDALSVAFTLSY